MKSILVPVDGSDHSCMAAAWAAKIASELGADVILLHTVPASAADTMAFAHLSREDIEERIQSVARKPFEKAKAAMPEGAQCETLVKYGTPAQEIVDVARNRGCDHIAMGSRGLTPMRELLLGSVSETVLRRAPCPVTVVR